MTRYRVAHVITRLCHGGAQENTFHTVRLADTDRFESHLIAGRVPVQETTLEPAIAAAGVAVNHEPALVRRPDPLNDYRALNALTRRFSEKRYDIVHTHTSKAGYLGRRAAKRAGVPIVVHTPHGNIFHGYFNPIVSAFYAALERQAAGWTDRIIALTERGVEEHLERRIGRREQYGVVFSGIDVTPYEEAMAQRAATRAELGIAEDELLIGGLGRLEPVKGFAYFVRAAREWIGAGRPGQFILAGHGSEAGLLREKAAPLGDRFRFLGHRNDAARLFAAMDIAVVPSINEGMGRVVLEAGAAGVPVIASAVGGIPNVIEDGRTGILVSSRDVAAIGSALQTLAADVALRARMGAAARATIVPAYSLESMVSKIEAIYAELVEEKLSDRSR